MTDSPSFRSLAFYNPGFQPTAETDSGYGKGWTEWTDVTAAEPLYVGHQQPRLPRDLSFYDLRVTDTRHTQVKLAAQYGIDGFVWDHYWFSGRRMYNISEPAGPFALRWKNEDFCTPQGHTMISQSYSEDDDRTHMHFVAAQMQRANYIRIDNKPLFVVNDVTALPNVVRTAEIWRDEARAAGIGEIFLAAMDVNVDPQAFGFDAVIDNAPKATGEATFYETLQTYNYLDMASGMLASSTDYRRFSCVTPTYDDSPAKAMNACIFLDSQPDLYRGWVASTVQNDMSQGAQDVVLFVNSWNDWTRGTQLEPCSVWGMGYLEAHKAGILQGFGVAEPAELPDNTQLPAEPVQAPIAPQTTEEPKSRVGVSVVMVTNGDAPSMMNALSSALNTCTDAAKLEFIVVDNGSTDDTAITLGALHNEVFAIRNETPIPANQAWWQGYECANGEYTLFLSNDVVMQPNWFEPALMTLATDPTCAAVTPLVQVGTTVVNSQPLTMATGVCLVARSGLIGSALPTEARSVTNSVVALAPQTPVKPNYSKVS